VVWGIAAVHGRQIPPILGAGNTVWLAKKLFLAQQAVPALPQLIDHVQQFPFLANLDMVLNLTGQLL
jgi:hypothetical protein